MNKEDKALALAVAYKIFIDIRDNPERLEFSIPTSALYLEARKELETDSALTVDSDELRDEVLHYLRKLLNDSFDVTTPFLSGIIKVHRILPEQFPEGTRLMCPACGLISNEHIFKGTHHICSDCETSSLHEQFIDEESCEQKKEIDTLEEELETLETRALEIKTLLANLYDDKYELWQVDYDVRV